MKKIRQIKNNSRPGDHDPQECGHKIKDKPIHHKPESKHDGKDIIKVQDGHIARQLIIPDRNPLEVPGILSKDEFERLKSQAHVVTMKEKLAKIEEVEKQRNGMAAASKARREKLEKEDLIRAQKQQKSTKLGKVEGEAKKRNLYLLERSFELIQEQDDRVKAANAIILSTKCRAIRNAQLSEKKLINKDLQEEEQRLDEMMEERRQREIKVYQQQKEEEEKKNKRFATELMTQIKENEIQKLIEAERVEEESRLLTKALIAMQNEEKRKLEEKHRMQEETRAELQKSNEELERYKMIKQEEDRIADMRVQEFMRKKAEREEAREQELLAQKAAKEKEIARLRAAQEKAADHQAALDEMNALRIQEEVEREWREKERRAAQRRQEQEDMIRMERAKQIEDIRRAQALTVAKDEEDFLKVVKIQKELYQKDMEKKKKQLEEAITHRNELLQQINDKEKERIKSMQNKFEEGRLKILETQLKDRHVFEYINKKVDKLRNALPEEYVQDIEKNIKLKI